MEDAYSAYQAGDYLEALRQCKPLADQGDAQAQALLGYMCQEGQGVDKDMAAAAAWYRKAAEQGEATACYNLARLCQAGEGVPQDDAAALRWLERAAQLGHKEAAENLRLYLKQQVNSEADNARTNIDSSGLNLLIGLVTAALGIFGMMQGKILTMDFAMWGLPLPNIVLAGVGFWISGRAIVGLRAWIAYYRALRHDAALSLEYERLSRPPRRFNSLLIFFPVLVFVLGTGIVIKWRGQGAKTSRSVPETRIFPSDWTATGSEERLRRRNSETEVQAVLFDLRRKLARYSLEHGPTDERHIKQFPYMLEFYFTESPIVPKTRLWPYHADSVAVQNFASLSDTATARDTGGWGYVNQEASADFGSVFINCTHTDDAGKAWDSY